MKKIISFIFVFCVFVPGRFLFACECSPATPEFAKATAIFIGEVTETQTEIRDPKPPIETTIFKVLKSYKGLSGAMTFVREGWFSDCDILFEKGKKYLIFARTEKGEWVTNVCDGTKELSDAVEDLQKLDELFNKSKETV